MRIGNDALRSRPDVVIAALDRSDANHRRATRIFSDGATFYLSTVNYVEVLVRPAADPATLRTAVDAITALNIEMVAPSAAMARDAAGLRGLGVSLPDCFAIATARARHASVATFDRRVRRALTRAGVDLAAVLKA
jgi:predicted nucleic acid-binding protein